MQRVIRATLHNTAFRSFCLYPLIVVGAELLLNDGKLRFSPWFLPLMVWGYLQYRLIRDYRMDRGGGGPGMKTMPDQIVTVGPYAWCRNPMYLGHIIFLTGLALTFQSFIGGVVAIAAAIWFHFRVRRDERRLVDHFGQPYVDYMGRVKRWGVF
jgi:hypothetical protein